MHILITKVHIILMELVRRICLNIKTSYPQWSLPLFLSLKLLNKWWSCKEKFHFHQGLGLKGLNNFPNCFKRKVSKHTIKPFIWPSLAFFFLDYHRAERETARSLSKIDQWNFRDIWWTPTWETYKVSNPEIEYIFFCRYKHSNKKWKGGG